MTDTPDPAPPDPAPVVIFGHGAPLDAPVLTGLSLRDVTRRFHDGDAESRIAPLLEPFLDPFVRAFLLGLEARAFDAAAAIVVWRQGAGALHAYRYACELRRLGLLPDGPELHLWNRAGPAGAAAAAFDAAEDARLALALAGVPRGTVPDRAPAVAALDAAQSTGAISGTVAFERRLRARLTGGMVETGPGPAATGPRLALAGAPLGGSGLHTWLETQGRLVLDLQGPDAPTGALGVLLDGRRVERLVWQVDPHDDLHGWHKPQVRAICAERGVLFSDLGFVPTWPDVGDLPEVLP
ncbi:MAG: hypothetical protein KDK12_17190 [Rhodobacteraceae bacterium]|nr:hypothetical protein [Paracoccaceae bacterium]